MQNKINVLEWTLGEHQLQDLTMVNVDLLYAKKDRGPRMDPLEAPAIRSDHGEC